MLTGARPSTARVLRFVATPLIALLLYDLAVVVGYKLLGWSWIGAPNVPVALYGSAIGIVVGFRNNSAYGRWWEARTLWGAIVNNCRSLARQVLALPRTLHAGDAAEAARLTDRQRQLVQLAIAYPYALTRHLRQLSSWDELARVLPATELEPLRAHGNVPLALQQRMCALVRDLQTEGWIDSIGWQAIDRNLDDLADAQGGCERIKNTPLPKQYDYLPRLFVQLYCLVLPVAMVHQLGWVTPLGSTLIGFIFLALDQIGRDLEDPFDNSIFDVAMSAISRTIEINLRQLLGERELPPPAQAQAGVLW